MKKLVPFLVLLICGQLYMHWTMPAPPAPEPVVAVAPSAPVERPKMYYHSPLDAQSMVATAYTQMGYFSTDPSSQFDPHQVINTSTTLVSNNGLNWGDESERADIARLQSVYKLPRTGLPGTLAGRAPASAYATE